MAEARGRITREELEAVLRQARQFYQRELQSADERHAPANGKRRKHRSVRAGDLGAAGRTHGNGAELALVVIHFCLESESLGAKMKHLWFAPTRSRSPARHALVLVGEGLDLAGRCYKVGTLGTDGRSNGVWVIDCELNIACRAHEFPQRMWEQLRKRHARERVPAAGPQPQAAGQIVPVELDQGDADIRAGTRQLADFGAHLLDSELSLHRAIGHDFPRQTVPRRTVAVLESWASGGQHRAH